jgi:DNA-binding cell septation regulator SpoVG
LAIRDMKIIDGPKGLFVAMPSKKQSSLATNCLQTVLLR